MSRIVLDTNAYSALLKGDIKILECLNTTELVFIPLFVLAELLFGFKNGKREKENREILNSFLARPSVREFHPGSETIEIFSEVMMDLKKSGSPLPTHDVWIAACAIELGAVIVTYDQHFSKISLARIWRGLDK